MVCMYNTGTEWRCSFRTFLTQCCQNTSLLYFQTTLWFFPMLEDFYSSKMACFLPHTEVASILLFHANVCFTISSQVTDWYFCWKSNISGAWTMIWYQGRFMNGLCFVILCLMFWDRVLTLWSPSSSAVLGLSHHCSGKSVLFSQLPLGWVIVLPSTCWVTIGKELPCESICSPVACGYYQYHVMKY